MDYVLSASFPGSSLGMHVFRALPGHLLVFRRSLSEAEPLPGWSLEAMGAALEGNMEIVRVLIDKGADVRAKAENGDTALQWGLRIGSKEIVELLRAHGAKE